MHPPTALGGVLPRLVGIIRVRDADLFVGPGELTLLIARGAFGSSGGGRFDGVFGGIFLVIVVVFGTGDGGGEGTEGCEGGTRGESESRGGVEGPEGLAGEGWSEHGGSS